jgi:dUTP pyrophosphatase
MSKATSKIQTPNQSKNTTLSKSPMTKESLKFFKLNESVELPIFATDHAACFDIHANIIEGEDIQYCSAGHSKQLPKRISFDINKRKAYIQLMSSERMLIPTGLIADIPVGFSVRLHPRSGLAFKQGVYLTNCEGVIDSDYVDPIFVMVTSISNVPVRIYSGDRICQGELVRCEKYTLDESDKAPSQKTNRVGGFGSTGV